MIARVHNVGRQLFGGLEKPLARAFRHADNPLNHLGALTVFFFYIVLVSGIWLLIFFRTSVVGAFDSVEYLTRQQWYLGGVMRSLHRYASDAAVVTILLHMLKEFVFDRYRRRRWFTWITGVPLIWLVFPLGITGYWLVWDQLAQYVAISSAELLDRIPIFTDSMAGNFLSDELLSDRFFTLMAFLHLIGLPIFLVFGIWLHVFRLTGPKIHPPRRLMAGTLLCLVLLSGFYPAVSHDRADLAAVPQVLHLDWFYLHVYPLIQSWSPGWVWVLLVGVSALLMLAPWAPPKKAEQAATVTLDYCNGCRRCVDDCPYGAVEMVARSDGASYAQQASVNTNLCVSCGICVGACPTATPFRSHGELIPGIDLPERPLAAIRADLVAEPAPDAVAGVLVVACRDDDRTPVVRAAGYRVLTVNCMGHLPPSFLDFILSRGHAAGVFLLGCPRGHCRHRFGADWTEQRIVRLRDPMLRRRVDTQRLALSWLPPWARYTNPKAAIDAFARRLPR